jgi:hypothetical protein
VIITRYSMLKVGDCCESRNTLMACECDFIQIAAMATQWSHARSASAHITPMEGPGLAPAWSVAQLLGSFCRYDLV